MNSLLVLAEKIILFATNKESIEDLLLFPTGNLIKNSIQIKIRLKSLLVLRTRGNHPTSRKSANDIAASNPPRHSRSFVVKFLEPSPKIEMDSQILQLFEMFFDKSVAEIFVQSCLHI